MKKTLLLILAIVLVAPGFVHQISPKTPQPAISGTVIEKPSTNGNNFQNPSVDQDQLTTDLQDGLSGIQDRLKRLSNVLADSDPQDASAKLNRIRLDLSDLADQSGDLEGIDLVTSLKVVVGNLKNLESRIQGDLNLKNNSKTYSAQLMEANIQIQKVLDDLDNPSRSI